MDRSKLDLYGLFSQFGPVQNHICTYLGSTRLIGPKRFCSASPALALNCVIIFWTKIGMLNESTLDFFQSNPYFLPNLPRLLAATFNLTTFLHIYEYLMSNELLISCRLTWISAEKSPVKTLRYHFWNAEKAINVWFSSRYSSSFKNSNTTYTNFQFHLTWFQFLWKSCENIASWIMIFNAFSWASRRCLAWARGVGCRQADCPNSLELIWKFSGFHYWRSVIVKRTHVKLLTF